MDVMTRRLTALVLSLVLSAALLGCGSGSFSVPTASPGEGDAATAVPAPIDTGTPEPTATAVPVPTVTAIPEPTATPQPATTVTPESVPEPAQTSNEADREALVALYHATDGPEWVNNDNWLSDRPLSEWHGVVTDDLGRVTELRLQNNRVGGEIPPELGQLSKLKRLLLNRDFWHGVWHANPLRGEIPSELGNLSDLEELNLTDNELSGAIPAELGHLTKLKELLLSDNDLSGTIPAELGRLSNLTRLHLARNDLSGAIPAELGYLSNLVSLELDYNDLSGAIPPGLGPTLQPGTPAPLLHRCERGDTG